LCRIILTNLASKTAMGKIATIEYFRVPPRWLFVKITDEHGNFGWGEASLEGHTQAVEGCLDAWIERYIGFEAEQVHQPPPLHVH
jgi:galactonate dehydratase